MNILRSLWAFILIVPVLAGCAGPSTFDNAARIDPSELLRILDFQRENLKQGFAGNLEMDFREGKRHYRGESFILVDPQGRFRLEVPGWMGSTLMIMVNDGRIIKAYYPKDNELYITSVSGRSLSPFLPFPFPLDPATLPSLISGIWPDNADAALAAAYINKKGERLLSTTTPDFPVLNYVFRPHPQDFLKELSVLHDESRLTVYFAAEGDNLPKAFTYKDETTALKGSFQNLKIFTVLNDAAFSLELPPDVVIRELDQNP